METAETIDSLRVHVRRGLDKFCLGQFFTEYGLSEAVKLIPDDVDTEGDLEASGLMDKKCAFQVFLKAVATEIVKEKGVTKGKKKRTKDYLEILQAFSSEWVDYIRKNMRKKQQAKMNKPKLGSPDAPGGDGSGTPLKKKGGKRGPRGPYKKRKQPAATAHGTGPAMSTPSPTKRKKVAPADIETARRDFEAEKEDTMTKVPQKNKKLFNQVGFAKWGKTSLPAMALDPYSVPPGDIREQWMKMFQNVVHKDRISKMGHLVWWIGPQTDGQSSYSVVPSHGFLSYEEGEKKNLHALPSKIKKLLDKGAELNKAQMETVEGLRILNELALQPKEEREHPRSDFTEEDYWGVDENEEEEAGGATPAASEAAAVAEVKEEDDEDEELLDDEEDLIDSSLEESGKKFKKKKGKKRKKDDIIVEEGDEDQTEVIYDDIEEEVVSLAGPPKKKKKKDKTKLERGRKKKKKKSMDGENDMQLDTVAEEEEEATLSDNARDPSDTANANNQDVEMGAVLAAPAPPQDALLDEPSVASKDSALADSDYGDDFDEKDEPLAPLVEVDETAITAKKPYKGKKRGPKPKKKEKDPDKEEKKLKKKKNKEKKEKAPKEPKKRTKALEQRELEKCEEDFLPMIEKLRSAKEKKDVAGIQAALQTLLPVAESFTASFFSEYGIPQIMKTVKGVLEDAQDGDTATYRKLWNAMKQSYTAKVKELPEGFKAKKGRGIKGALKKSAEREPDDGPSGRAFAIKEDDVKSHAKSADPLPANESADVSSSTPSGKIPVTDVKRRTSVGSDELAKAIEKTSAAKAKLKKFSISDFMGKKKDSKRLSIGSDKSGPAALTGGPSKKTVPSWVTAPLPTSFDSFVGSDKREDRMFALEFLLQAAAHFPANKGVNEESVARSLEMAIHEWAQDQRGSWADAYWDKVHSLVAAITGKRDIGTLVDLVMSGAFQSPKALTTLPVEVLENSFEGRPIILND